MFSIGREFFLSKPNETAQVGGPSIYQPKGKDALMKVLMGLEGDGLDDEIFFDSAEGNQDPEEWADKEESEYPKVEPKAELLR